jgi:hypothetical protein
VYQSKADATQSWLVGQEMPDDRPRPRVKGLSVHVAPPSVEVRDAATPPALPPATQVDAVQSTVFRVGVEEATDGWFHVAPPSELKKRMSVDDGVPPTATQSDGDGHDTPSRVPVTEGAVCCAQVVPPSTVETMTGLGAFLRPTATQSDAV